MVDQGAFRVLLQDLHSELPDEDVKCMKFLAQPLIKKRLYDDIKNGLQLFEALEDCCMLSSDFLSYLSELLETAGRLDLQARVTDELMDTDATSGEESLICPFRKLLYNLHKEIPDNDLSRMRYLYVNVPKRAVVTDPLDLFGFMMRDRSLTPENFDTLKRILSEISRQDLVEEILHFEVTVKPNECGYPSQQYSGPTFQKASHESSTYFSSSSEEPSSFQESGISYQDTEQPMSGPVYRAVSYESSSQAASLSSYSRYTEEAIEDLKAAVPTATGMHTGTAIAESPIATGMCTRKVIAESPITTGMCTGTAASAARGDFEMKLEQKMNAASSDRYKMDTEPRGWCLIIDVQSFNDQQRLKYRAGSEIDRGNLISTFTRLKFSVKQMLNPSAADIINALQAVSRDDHSAYDCLVICILSHGGADFFYGRDGERVYENTVFNLYSAKECPSLAGKPKLFFFSYCRGNHEREGVPVIETDSPLVPDLSDFLFGYATPQNYVSYRNRSRGTFYIDVLTRVLDEEAERTELQHLLLRVNREVAELSTGTLNRQIPKPEHTLKRQLYFL